MRAQESVRFTNISATTAAFELKGGTYVIGVSATFGGGSVTLQKLAADDTTWITASTALTAAGVSAAVAASPGQYRFAIATATTVYVDITRVPSD